MASHLRDSYSKVQSDERFEKRNKGVAYLGYNATIGTQSGELGTTLLNPSTW